MRQTFSIGETVGVHASLLRITDRPVDGQLNLRVKLGLKDDVVDFFERESPQTNAIPLNHLIT